MVDLLVPGHGAANRTANLLKNVCALRQQSPGLRCTIAVYNHDLRLGDACDCAIHRRPGTWVRFMRTFRARSAHVLLMLDDVVLHAVNLADMLRRMREHHIDVLAPSIREWHHPIMRPRYRRHIVHRNILGETPIFARRECRSRLRSTVYVDMLFVLFTREAWECWRRNLDEENQEGWGHDLLFWKSCRVKMQRRPPSRLARHVLSRASSRGDVRPRSEADEHDGRPDSAVPAGRSEERHEVRRVMPHGTTRDRSQPRRRLRDAQTRSDAMRVFLSREW